MEKKKSIILIVCGILSLITITIIFLLLLKQPNTDKTFAFSKQETINVSTKTEDISFFNNVDFTKLLFNDDKLINEFKNIVNVSENSVIMKNVFLYDATGDYTINYKDNIFSNSEFNLMKSKSSSDAFSTLNKLNEKIATLCNTSKKEIKIINSDSVTKLENEIQLHQKNSKVNVEYKTGDYTFVIELECGKEEYNIKITLK